MNWFVLIAVAIAGLILLWMPIMLVATLFSGWWELSHQFPKRRPGVGAKRGLGSVAFSPVFQYKRCVNFAIDDDFLHLSLPPLLGIFHGPISIPWSMIQFPVGAKRVAGMTLLDVRGRRFLVSRAMAQRELEVREHIATQDESGAAPVERLARTPVSQPNQRTL
ncbi:MAG: hypothetical protein KDA20_01400 [Phycisphaerales bacterium]|nr:hypothetical protein [Phycisphaerales bacterium]